MLKLIFSFLILSALSTNAPAATATTSFGVSVRIVKSARPFIQGQAKLSQTQNRVTLIY